MAGPGSSTARLLAEASADTTAPGRLAELSAHPSGRVRDAVACNPSADDDTVIALAGDVVEDVRLAAATNAAGRPSAEAPMAASPDRWVRAILAHTYARQHDAHLLRATQEHLLHDAFYEVRARLAETTEYRHLYDTLLDDPDPRVRGSCALNLRTTAEDAERLLTDRAWQTRATVVAGGVHHPDGEGLLRAARDRSARVRWEVLYRAGTPPEVAALLQDDPDQLVREAARSALEGHPRWDPEGEADAIAQRAASPRLTFLATPQAEPATRGA